MEVVRTRGSWTASLKGRSFCGGCRKDLEWYELVPIISFFFLKGKCTDCGSNIPYYHLTSEILFGIALVSTFYFNNVYIFLTAIFLIPIIIADLENYDVPYHFSIPLFVTAILVSIIYTGGIFFGLALALPFFLFWLISKGKWMGLGDTHVALPLGMFLNSFYEVLNVFLFTFWVGAAFIILAYIVGIVLRKKSIISFGKKIPLVPSMAVAFYLVLVFNVDIFTIF